MANLPPELQEAHKLFLRELHGHVATVREKIATADFRSLDSIEATRKALEHRFHTIRGGAGFFQLDEVLSAATLGESELRKGRQLSEYREFLEQRVPEIIELFELTVSTNGF